MAPLFSVVIPAYLRSESIVPTLQSVAEQTFTDWECIVVDDGSPNAAVLKAEVQSMNDYRFKYVWRENGGGSAARNTGVGHASGSFIAYLDSDDLFLPHKLQRIAEVLPEVDANVCIFSYVLMRRGEGADWRRPDRPIRSGEDLIDYYFAENQHFNSSALVVPRKLALEIPWDPSLRKMQDVDLLVRLNANNTRFVMIEEPLSVWVDQTEENRVSRHPGFEAPTAWLERSRPLLSERAVYGFKATMLAYFVARQRPLTALRYLYDGLIKGRVPPRVIGRQFLRCFLPRGWYRKLVDAFVRVRGRNQVSPPASND